MAALIKNNVPSGTKSIVKIVVPLLNAIQSITGFVAPASGTRLLIVLFDASTSILHNNVSSDAGNRILLHGGTDKSFSAGDTLNLIYHNGAWQSVAETPL